MVYILWTDTHALKKMFDSNTMMSWKIDVSSLGFSKYLRGGYGT